jgi:hypothetical protein
VRRAVALLAVLALSCTHSSKPRIDGVQEFKGLSHDHVRPPMTYPQTPPVGGAHSDRWIRCAVYTEPLPDINAVHSMEHGAVWITYQPSLSQADVDALHRFQGLDPAYVLISPYPGLPSPVVVTTWGLQLKVDRVDDPRIGEFVKRYAGGNQGGEGGVPCVRDGLTPEQARQYDAPQTAASPAM